MCKKYFIDRNKILIDKLKNLSDSISSSIRTFDDKNCKRNRSITSANLYHYCVHKNINNLSYNETTADFQLRNLNQSSSQAFHKKITNTHVNDFNNIYVNLLEHIYDNHKQKRFLAVDGSELHMYKQTEGFDKNDICKKNKKYKTCFISCIFDVNLEIPINYNLTTSKDERDSFTSQLKYLRKGDVVIFDAGYYSKDLAAKLTEMEIDFIFRLPVSNLYSKKLIKNNSDEQNVIFKHKKINKTFRAVYYNLDSSKELAKKRKSAIPDRSDYYILTSLDEDYSINDIKNLYFKRWSVETHFRYAKYMACLGRINVRSLNMLSKNLSFVNFGFLFMGYIEQLIYSSCNINTNTEKFNKKITKLVLTKYLNEFITGIKSNSKLNMFLKDLNILLKFLLPVRNNRHHRRETKIPINHWGSQMYFYT